ncbi:MAG: hypothetical protein OEW17_05270 [Gemmatimonadota bacterium]|nr:hypothetical protein [Gemmatimonadota bacterium]MDH4348193.1 hypothetical protein [Gemmatimonadota bacterium]
MSGHVFHPGHSDLHGVTVVLETDTGVLYVGRYHEETAAGVLLHDAAEHQPAPGGTTAQAFVEKTLKFGVRAAHRNIVVPAASVRRVSRLVDWTAA